MGRGCCTPTLHMRWNSLEALLTDYDGRYAASGHGVATTWPWPVVSSSLVIPRCGCGGFAAYITHILNKICLGSRYELVMLLFWLFIVLLFSVQQYYTSRLIGNKHILSAVMTHECNMYSVCVHARHLV